jgi:hypothetical protein
VLLRSHELRRQGDHPPNVSFPPTRSNMDELQADASTIPDDSVDHVANALANMQVTAPAAATVPASTLVDPADRNVRQGRSAGESDVRYVGEGSGVARYEGRC